MINNVRKVALYAISISVLFSCRPSMESQGIKAGGGARISSITMPIPEKIKPYLAPDKINAFSLTVLAGACDSGVVGTNINKVAAKVDVSGANLDSEKIRQGCGYTLSLSLGKSDSSGSKLEKVYLTNDLDGKKTIIPIEKTRMPKIQVTAVLFITEDGKKDLNMSDLLIQVPSTIESDTEIGIDIAQDASQNGQSTSQSALDYDYRKDIVLSDVPFQSFAGTDYGSAYYKDIMTHTPPSDRDFQYGPSTHAHESLHGLHAFMRNRNVKHDSFFYLGNGKGAYVKEPIENAEDVRNHIGDSFRRLATGRYDLYLIEQTVSWKKTLYFFDEWNAYVGTTRSAVEIQRAGRWNPSDNSDPIEGLVDFMYFCSASIISIKNVDPGYLSSNKQFKATYAAIMEESSKWMNEARKEKIWVRSKAWIKMQNFQTAADGAEVRKAVKDLMGETWTKRVLGF